MNVRIELRLQQSWDQLGIVVHPDEDMARQLSVATVDAWYQRFGRPCRATVGDNPPESGRWAEGEVFYARGT